MVWHPALLFVFEEEATWFWALRLENDEKHREFHLYLEMLARIFHAFHCLPRQWIRRASRTFTDQSLVLVALLLPLPIQLSSAPCRFKLLRKKTSTSDKHISVLFCLCMSVPVYICVFLSQFLSKFVRNIIAFLLNMTALLPNMTWITPKYDCICLKYD